MHKVRIRCDKHIRLHGRHGNEVYHEEGNKCIASNKIEAAEPTLKTTSFSEEERCEGEVEKDLTDGIASVRIIFGGYAT